MSFMLACEEQQMSHSQHTIHKHLCTYTHTVQNTEQYGNKVKTLTSIHHMCMIQTDTGTVNNIETLSKL
jgi:hypothetical protein